MDKAVDISSIEKAQPVFETPPAVDSNGVLVVKGSYDAKRVIDFDLKYVPEDGAWKLLSINVQLP